MKLRIHLFFLLAFGSANSYSHQCKKSLVESYSINSYAFPSREHLILCPSVKATCCPAYEQFKMFNEFNNNIRPGFKLFNVAIRRALHFIGRDIAKIVNSPRVRVNKKMIKSRRKYVKARRLLLQMRRLRLKVLVRRALKYQRRSGKYMAGLKSLFFCHICDYNNQPFFNERRKTVTFSGETCDALVHNTIYFANVLNRGIIPYLEKFVTLTAIIKPKIKPLRKLYA